MDVIDTSTMPGDDMDPDAIAAAAKKIRSSGARVSKTTTATHTAWAKISGVYHAPEQGRLYEAMNPVKTEGETFGSDLDSAASALETFAETVRTIKAAVVKIRADVKTFEDKIADDGTIQPAGGYNPYAGGIKLRIQWNEDKGMVAEQHRLAKEIDDQVDAMQAAETTCANSIDDITGAAHVPTTGPKAPPAPPHIPEAQWYLTAPINRKENCGEQIGHALIIDWAGGMVSGVAGLVGLSWSPTTGKFANWWDTMKGSWGGLTKFSIGLNPLQVGLLALIGQRKLALDSMMSVTAFVGDQFSIDPFAKDPTQRYKDQPYRAWTYTALNLASWLAPPLKGLAAAKAGKAAELAGDAAKVGDLSKVGEATRFGSAADLAKALRESGSLDKLGKVGDLLKAKIAGRVGKASDFTHVLDEVRTPELSKYDMDAGQANPHTDPVPVHDGVNPEVTPGHGHPVSAADHPSTDPGTGSDHPADNDGHPPGTSEHPGAAAHDARDVTQPHVLGKPFWGDELGASHQRVVERSAAHAEYQKLAEKSDKLAHDLGVESDDLTSKKLKKTIGRLLNDADSPAELSKIRALQDATRAKLDAYTGLRDASERMGVTASRAYSASRGEALVGGLSDDPGRPATLDTVGWNQKKLQLSFYEAKGGDSPQLGTRKVDGITTSQGSAAYLQDLVGRDPEVRTFLRSRPDVLQGLIDAKVKFDYYEVSARTDGRVRITHFDIRPSEVDFSALQPKRVSPAR